jgi:hypothetical protein
MENWRTHITRALGSCDVLVCNTSAKYFNSSFCGKEFFVFDQRRQGLKPRENPPANILSIVWYPVEGGLPDYMQDSQLVPQGVSEKIYLEKGLRHLMRLERRMYESCVVEFAAAIR